MNAKSAAGMDLRSGIPSCQEAVVHDQDADGFDSLEGDCWGEVFIVVFLETCACDELWGLNSGEVDVGETNRLLG